MNSTTLPTTGRHRDARAAGDAALKLEGVTKTFPGVRALRGVDLTLRAGAVHALLGENGAGKSTLIKVATGAIVCDSGDLHVAGQLVTHPTRRSLQALGVRAIYQERQIAADLTVAENVLLDRLPRRLGFVDWTAAARLASERLHALGIDLDPRSPARQLNVAQRQLVEIARAVSLDARVVVMDEPTASLARHEVQPLFAVVRRMRDAGVAVLFISHHLEEVFEISDDFTVLRDGEVVASGAISTLTPESAVAAMFGRPIEAASETGTSARAVGEVCVEVRSVSTARLDAVSVDIRAGEVVAVTGGTGAGVSDLARVVAGALRPTSGHVSLGASGRGRSVVTSRRQAVAAGVALLPADRKRQGLLLDRSVADNITLGLQARDRSVLIRPRALRRRGADLARSANVKTASADTVVRTLSGGNQQKVMIGRALGISAQVIVFDEPTAGVDISAKFEIYEQIRKAADAGAAVLLCSTDFQEVGQVADRVIVLRSGRVVGEVSGRDASEHRLIEIEMGRS